MSPAMTVKFINLTDRQSIHVPLQDMVKHRGIQVVFTKRAKLPTLAMATYYKQSWNHLQASGVPLSQVQCNVPQFQPSSILCYLSNLWSFFVTQLNPFLPVQLSNNLLHFLYTDLVSNSTYDPFCEVSPKSLLYSSLYSLTRHNELTSSTIDSIAAAPTPVAVSESVLFRNPSFLNSNLDLADSISRAVTAAVLEWCFGYLSALFTNSPEQPSSCSSILSVKIQVCCMAHEQMHCLPQRRYVQKILPPARTSAWAVWVVRLVSTVESRLRSCDYCWQRLWNSRHLIARTLSSRRWRPRAHKRRPNSSRKKRAAKK